MPAKRYSRPCRAGSYGRRPDGHHAGRRRPGDRCLFAGGRRTVPHYSYAHALWQDRTLLSHARDCRLLGAQRLCCRGPGRARQMGVRRKIRTQPESQRGAGRLRHHRLDCKTALVQWPSRHVGRILLRLYQLCWCHQRPSGAGLRRPRRHQPGSLQGHVPLWLPAAQYGRDVGDLHDRPDLSRPFTTRLLALAASRNGGRRRRLQRIL